MALTAMVSLRLDNVVADCDSGEHNEQFSTSSAESTSDCNVSDGDDARSSFFGSSGIFDVDGEALGSDSDACSEGVDRPDIEIWDNVAITQGLFAGQDGIVVKNDESNVKRRGHDCLVELTSGMARWFARIDLEIMGTNHLDIEAPLLELGSSECADSDTDIADDGLASDVDRGTCDVDSAQVDDIDSDCQRFCIRSALGIVVNDVNQDAANVGNQQAIECIPRTIGSDLKQYKRNGSSQWIVPELSGLPKFAPDMQELQEPSAKRVRVELPVSPETIASKLADARTFAPNGPRTLAEVESKVEA